ncbi:hypothetical protein [Fundidesulfovibrio terrae]|uniref:hypothetical protein n=1 Tax=Fundidesulfovibrio terrae TaxID=2922866 RepID=UPI001FB02B3F|nr:hypothetical protein [Fundidesulfovibrio terrae]
MHCPHCQGRLPAHKPVTNPRRVKLYGHHGEMELDAGLLKAMAENSMKHLSNRRKRDGILATLEVYKEVVSRMEHDPAFARHVLSYDGNGGARFFPGATKAARLAEFKGRIARGDLREDDLLRYIELMTDN